jgi:hypothetical protein
MPENEWPAVRKYLIALCDDCVAGKGWECHTPGCRGVSKGNSMPMNRDNGVRSIRQIADDVLRCATSWEPSARLIGNVSAKELAALSLWVLTAHGVEVVVERKGGSDA